MASWWLAAVQQPRRATIGTNGHYHTFAAGGFNAELTEPLKDELPSTHVKPLSTGELWQVNGMALIAT